MKLKDAYADMPCVVMQGKGYGTTENDRQVKLKDSTIELYISSKADEDRIAKKEMLDFEIIEVRNFEKSSSNDLRQLGLRLSKRIKETPVKKKKVSDE